MNNIKIAKIISVIVMISGITVMIGWIFDIGVLKSILPNWVTMKFTTALSFLLSGIILYFIIEATKGKSEIADIVLPIASLIILLLMVTILASLFFGIRTGVEDLFVKEAKGAVVTTIPGRPSVATIIDFILIAIAGILTMFKSINLIKQLFWIGFAIGLSGILAVIGYVIDVPLFYYFIEGKSTAMAIHTAILFTIIGIGLFILKKEKSKISIEKAD